jgi:hypothetical protein
VSGDGALAALYPAVAAVAVAAFGLVGNVILYRRRREDDDPEATITALATALATERARADRAELRCAECEAREQARGEPRD